MKNYIYITQYILYIYIYKITDKKNNFLTLDKIDCKV